MRLWRIVLVFGFVAGLAFGRTSGRYIRWNEIQPLLAGIPASADKPLEVTDSKQWDGWIRLRDAQIRGGVDRGIEDSISMLILLGTSFSTQPPLTNPAEAVNAAGALTPAARARMEAFISGLDQIDDERFRSMLQFLRRQQISQEELRPYLSGNLRRAALEWSHHPRLRPSSLGVSGIEQTLRALVGSGKAPGRIRRIAVIGPGFNPEFDPETYNLFAGLEAALTSGLAKQGDVELTVFDVNPWFLSHVRADAGKAGSRYGARIHAEDLNIVAQTVDSAPGQGFDLVVAVTALAAYNRLDQTLVMANVARMIATGGVFLANDLATVTTSPEFEAVGATACRRR